MLEEYVKKHPLAEMKRDLGFGQSGIAAENHIKKIYRERSHEDRQNFIEKIAKIDHLSIVYIDEAGISYIENIPRGEKIYANIPGKKRQRISIIGGWIERRFVAPMTFIGGCDKEVFNTWLDYCQSCLLTQL